MVVFASVPQALTKLRQLIARTTETATSSERKQIIDHVAAEKFSDETRTVADWTDVGLNVEGRPHPSQPGVSITPSTSLTSLEWHVVKHTATGSWQEGTTTDEYLDDLRTAIKCPSAALHVGRDRKRTGGYRSRAGLCTELARINPSLKKAVPAAGRHVLTIYDPERRRLLSSYGITAKELPRLVLRWENHRTV